MTNANKSIAAIVLAGGVSRRMGKDNKLHLEIDGRPLLRHSLEILLAADLGEIVVVLGHEFQSTCALLDGLAVRTVLNENYLSGQMTSVHCGLAALGQACDGVMVALADQPALTVADYNHLIEAYRNRSAGEVVVPEYQGKRGNPIILSERSRRDILDGKQNFGCRRFIEKNPHLVQRVTMSNPAVVMDLDTPQDYQNYCGTYQTDRLIHTANDLG